MNKKILFSVFNTVLKTYSSKLIAGHGLKVFQRSLCTTKIPTTYFSRPVQPTTNNDDLVTYDEVKKIGLEKPSDIILIDVREPKELKETGVLPSSINIPLGEVECILKNMPNEEFKRRYGRDKPSKEIAIIFSCKAGTRSSQAQVICQHLGYTNVKNYIGGWLDWEANNKNELLNMGQEQAEPPTVSYEEVRYMKDDPNYLLIDVRQAHELEEDGAIPGSINIPLDILEQTLVEVSNADFLVKYGREKPGKDFNIIFSCRSGNRSKVAQEKALALGYKNVLNYSGSWLDWKKRTTQSQEITDVTQEQTSSTSEIRNV